MQKITSKFWSLHLHLHLQVNICIFIDFAPSSWKTQQQHVLFSVYVLCSGRMLSWGRRDRFGYSPRLYLQATTAGFLLQISQSYFSQQIPIFLCSFLPCIKKWGTVALWISHLLTMPCDPGSKPDAEEKIYFCSCVFICSVKRILINKRAPIGANL